MTVVYAKKSSQKEGKLPKGFDPSNLTNFVWSVCHMGWSSQESHARIWWWLCKHSVKGSHHKVPTQRQWEVERFELDVFKRKSYFGGV